MERATDEPSMLIVTYEGEHRHSQGGSIPVNSAGDGGSTLVAFESTMKME